MGANVQRLVEEGGAVRGVRYRGPGGWHEVRAPLTVGADGRFSRLRHLAGFEARPLAAPFELLWFRLPRLPGDEERFAPAPMTSSPHNRQPPGRNISSSPAKFCSRCPPIAASTSSKLPRITASITTFPCGR